MNTPGNVMNGLALSCCALLFVWRCRRLDASRSLAIETAICGVIGAVLGARLGAMLLAGGWSADGGASSWGAYVGGALAATMRLWGSLGWRVGAHLDAAAPAVLLGIAIARIGCLLNGDDFGLRCTSGWCVTFPQGTEAFVTHMQRGWVAPEALTSLPVYPLQVYLSAAALLSSVLVLGIGRNRSPGRAARLAIWLYATTRAPLELLRDHGSSDGRPFGFLVACGFSVAVACYALIRRAQGLPQRAAEPS